MIAIMLCLLPLAKKSAKWPMGIATEIQKIERKMVCNGVRLAVQVVWGALRGMS